MSAKKRSVLGLGVAVGVVIAAWVLWPSSGDFLYDHWKAAGNQNGGGVNTKLMDSKLIKVVRGPKGKCSLGWIDVKLGVSSRETGDAAASDMRLYVLDIDQGAATAIKALGENYIGGLAEFWSAYECPGNFPLASSDIKSADSISSASVEGKKPIGTTPPQGATSPVALDVFTLNLQPELGEQYLQVKITLLTSHPNAVTSRMDEVRNKVLMLLSSKKASQISSVAGKEELAREIVQSVNSLEPNESLGVREALFTSFLIQ